MRLMLDVHKASVTACVRILDENEALHQEIREFGFESSPPPLEGSCCSETGWLPLR